MINLNPFTAIGQIAKEVVDATVYLVDSAKGIPDSVADGYQKGIFSEESEPQEADAVTPGKTQGE